MNVITTQPIRFIQQEDAFRPFTSFPDRIQPRQALGFVEFSEGHRYSDYKPGTDKVAAYGIGALIAGKLLAKAGLFKLLLGLLIAGKKFVVIGLIALGVLLKKLFTGRSKGEGDPDETISLTGQNS